MQREPSRADTAQNNEACAFDVLNMSQLPWAGHTVANKPTAERSVCDEANVSLRSTTEKKRGRKLNAAQRRAKRDGWMDTDRALLD